MKKHNNQQSVITRIKECKYTEKREIVRNAARKETLKNEHIIPFKIQLKMTIKIHYTIYDNTTAASCRK